MPRPPVSAMQLGPKVTPKVPNLTKLSDSVKAQCYEELQGWIDLGVEEEEDSLVLPEKWRLRLPPIAAWNPDLPAKESEYTDYSNWGLGDEYVGWLCHQQPESLKSCRSVQLEQNRLTARGAALLAEAVGSTAERLVLRHNSIGLAGCRALSSTLQRGAGLTELDLTGNNLRDHGVVELCEGLMTCGQLKVLSLGRNQLGSAKVGFAIAKVVSNTELQSLDLHWNQFTGKGLQEILQALGRSKTLLRLNLSWNSLGKDKISKEERDDNGFAKSTAPAAKTMDILGAVIANNSMLFHADISYNRIRAADAENFCELMKENHTLFGLHVAGNELIVDDMGFVAPMTGEDQMNAVQNLSLVDEIPSKLFQGGGARRPAACRAVLDEGNMDREQETLFLEEALKPEVAPGGDPFYQHMRDLNFCWICQNWFECEIVFNPEPNGLHPEDIESVYVFTSLDGFMRPMQLFKREKVRKAQRRGSNRARTRTMTGGPCGQEARPGGLVVPREPKKPGDVVPG
jgi:hypothetical protein